jgi:hypothetical protein
VLGGFLGRYDGELWHCSGDRAAFVANPVRLLERLYHFLDLEDRPDKPPSEKIWDHDQESWTPPSRSIRRRALPARAIDT